MCEGVHRMMGECTRISPPLECIFGHIPFSSAVRYGDGERRVRYYSEIQRDSGIQQAL